ncbi:MAG: AAA family ATPase [Pirellulaceae bacterium]
MNQIQAPDLFALITKLETNISAVVLGKQDVARQCMVALLSGEHVLLEDVPGVGKTLMGKALSRSVDGDFCRLQFTPDLLPSDIVGSSVFNSQTQEFVFHPGPIFSNFVLADEINRAPPRTQSALLEAMSDGQVSVDGTTHALPRPFMVIATQNPFEFEGTYVLPESQLDRFLLRVSMGYPDREYEQEILNSHRVGEPVENLTAVVDRAMIEQMQTAVRNVKVEPSISQYMLDVVHATRESSELAVGVSTRGALLWNRAAQAAALIDGRDYVVPDDAKQLCMQVLAHRVMLQSVVPGGDRSAAESVIRQIIDTVPAP